jgi:predicted DCC family thiol-disulfide oxidoreductase YuxK
MKLTVLFDASCALCVRCRDFLARSDTFVPLELLACQSTEARRRYGAIPWLGEELVVVNERGDVWVGSSALLMCLWALRDYREWSYRLSGPLLAPPAERFFLAVSAERAKIARFVGKPRCEEGVCRIDHGGAALHAPRAEYR